MRQKVCLLFLVFNPCLWAFQQPNVPEVQESMRVDLHKIIVRVLDEQGEPVTGLTLKNFELLNHGKSAELTYVEEKHLETKPTTGLAVHAEKAEAPVPIATNFRKTVEAKQPPIQRSLVLFIDTANMNLSTFQNTKNALRSFLRENVSNKDLVKLVQIEQKMTHLTPFTQNRLLLLEAIEKLEFRGSLYRRIRDKQNELNRSLEEYFSLLAVQQDSLVVRRLETQREAINTMVLEKRSIKENHFITFFENARLLARILMPMPGDRSIFMITGGAYMDLDTQKELRNISARMNHANISMHALLVHDTNLQMHPILTTPTDQPNLALDYISALEPSKTAPDSKAPSTINSTKLYRDMGFSKAMGESLNTIVENKFQLKTGPQTASEDTGGVYEEVLTTMPLEVAIEKTFKKASHFYEVFYLSDHEKQSLKVVLKNGEPGWHTTFGKRGISTRPDKTRAAMSEVEKEIDFFATIQYADESSSRLNCQWGFNRFGSPEKGYTFPVYGQLQLDESSDHSYEIGIAVLDADREILAVCYRLIEQLNWGRNFTFYDFVESGIYPASIRCLIREMNTGRMAIKEFIPEPLPSDDQPYLSDLVLAQYEPLYRRPLFLAKNDEIEDDFQDRNGLLAWHPLAPNFGRLYPGHRLHFTNPEMIQVYFQLHQSQHSHKSWEVMTALLKDGKPVEAEIKLAHARDLDQATAIFNLNIDPTTLSEGQYTLWVRLQDSLSGSSAMASQSFVIKLVKPFQPNFHYFSFHAQSGAQGPLLQTEATPWLERDHFQADLMLDDFFYQAFLSFQDIYATGPGIWPREVIDVLSVPFHLHVFTAEGKVLFAQTRQIQIGFSGNYGQLQLSDGRQTLQVSLIQDEPAVSYANLLHGLTSLFSNQPIPEEILAENQSIWQLSYFPPEILDTRWMNYPRLDQQGKPFNLPMPLAAALLINNEEGLHFENGHYLERLRDTDELRQSAFSLEENNLKRDSLITFQQYFDRMPSDRKAAQHLLQLLLEDKQLDRAFRFLADYQPYFAYFRQEERANVRFQWFRRKKTTQQLDRQTLTDREKLLGSTNQFRPAKEGMIRITQPQNGDLVPQNAEIQWVLRHENAPVLLVEVAIDGKVIAATQRPGNSMAFNPATEGAQSLTVTAYFEDNTFVKDEIQIKGLFVDLEEKIRLARLEVVAIDEQGNPLLTLEPNRLQILENRESRHIQGFESAQNLIDVVLLLDNSFSMTGEKNRMAMVATHRLLTRLEGPIQTEIYAYDEKVFRIKHEDQSYEAVQGLLFSLTPMLGTAMFDALLTARSHLLAKEETTKAIILITDGEDSMSISGRSDIQAALNGAPIRIYPILTGEDPDHFLETLAKESGGRAFKAKTTDQLLTRLQDIMRELRSIYQIDYYSQLEAQERARIEVKTSEPNVKLRWTRTR